MNLIDYHTLAIKCLGKYCHSLSCDEDSISDAASILMREKLRWDGKGNMYKFIISRLKMQIPRLIKRRKKFTHFLVKKIEKAPLNKNLANKDINPIVKLLKEETRNIHLKKIFSNQFLSHQEKTVLLYTMDNFKQIQIARIMGVSRERIRQIYNKAVEKLQ